MVDIRALLRRARHHHKEARRHNREAHQGIIGAFDHAEAEEAQARRDPSRDIEILPDPRRGTCQFTDPENPRAWIEVDEYTPVEARQ